MPAPDPALSPYQQHVTAVGRLLRSKHGEPRILERLVIPHDPSRPITHTSVLLDDT